MKNAIGFDCSALDSGFKAHALRGTGRYVQELKNFFASANGSDFSVEPFAAQDVKGFSLLRAMEGLLPFGKQTFRQQLIYPLSLRDRSYRYIHFPAHIDAPSWFVPGVIVTVLDLIPIKFAELYRPKQQSWRFELARKLEIQSIRHAQRIIAISEQTARDVVELLGVPEDRIRVTYLGVDESRFKASAASKREELAKQFSLDPERPWMLYVGGIDQRKNVTTLVDVFAEVLKQSPEDSRPQLLLVGDIQGDECYPALRQRMKSNEVESEVCELGFVSDAMLAELYREAALFIFPSLYEGFGLPPLEAMASGCPVVSSSAGSLAEVLGEAALLFDPNSVEEGTKAVLELLSDKELADSLRRKGTEQAKQFSWQRTGEQTLDVYRELAQA